MQPAITLTLAELVLITGYQRAGDQVRELHRQGYSRARRSPTTGDVILERAHFEAVCRGHQAEARPKVRPPVLRGRATA
jgi:hypothetical protein